MYFLIFYIYGLCIEITSDIVKSKNKYIQQNFLHIGSILVYLFIVAFIFYIGYMGDKGYFVVELKGLFYYFLDIFNIIGLTLIFRIYYLSHFNLSFIYLAALFVPRYL